LTFDFLCSILTVLIILTVLKGETMNNKELQRNRMENYFIEATKEIIAEEGIDKVSVRKVGEKAGYSYATIYNYFSDLNELLANTAYNYLEDCYQEVLALKDGSLSPLDQTIKYSLGYFNYFAKKPNIFKIVFLNDYGDVPTNIAKSKAIPSIAPLLIESISRIDDNTLIVNPSLAYELLASSTHGKLMFYVTSRHHSTIEIIAKQIELETRTLLGGKL